MKAFTLFTALIAASFIPTTVFAQPVLKPCGTITRSTILKGDCAAPLIVGADNIKINLNGFAVSRSLDYFPEPGIGDIHIQNRRGVTITNGKVEGACYLCIRIRGGYSNRVNNMSILAGEAGNGVIIDNSRGNLIKNIKVISGGARVGVNILRGDKNIIDHLTSEGFLDSGAYISGNRNRLKRSVIQTQQQMESPVGVWVIGGKRNVIDKNEIRCGGGEELPGILLFRGSSDTTIKSNSINGCQTGIDTEAARTIISDNRITNSVQAGIKVTSLENTIRSNTVENSGTVDMLDSNPNCGTNDWRNNSFLTDSEGDGPSGGCIR